MKLRRRRRVKAFPQKRSQLGGCGLLPAAWGCGALPRPERLAGQRLRRRPDKCDAGRRPSGRRIPRPAASGRTRSLRCTAFFPPKPLRWVSAGALLGEVIRLPFCIFGVSVWGWYHYPRHALHAIETLDARGSRRRIRRFYAAPEFALCGLNLPAAGTHATPAPNRAHSGLHAETRRVLRVDGDDVFGSKIIDTIGPFQADQTVAVALAEGYRDTVSP